MILLTLNVQLLDGHVTEEKGQVSSGRYIVLKLKIKSRQAEDTHMITLIIGYCFGESSIILTIQSWKKKGVD